jgi:hypothetical protein
LSSTSTLVGAMLWMTSGVLPATAGQKWTRHRDFMNPYESC